MTHRLARVLLVPLLVVLGTAYLSVRPADADDRVTLCHFPPGHPENFHTITVGAAAAEAHIRNHGDVLGECCAIDAICDDGNACTANFCADNVCTSEPVDCDDGNPCTNEVGCDPQVGCISEPVTCGEGEACNRDTGACLPVGQCPCWSGSNPIALLERAFANANPFTCVEPTSLTCSGNAIILAGQGSGPNGASASMSMRIARPASVNSCSSPGGGGSGTCSCPAPPDPCTAIGVQAPSTGLLFPEPTSCIEEFDAACAALQ
jgi:hypothetical protein